MSSSPPPSDQGRGEVAAGSSTALLDREDERKVIEDLVSAIQDGFGRAIVLHGEAGMGKTRLLQHAVDSAPGLRRVWVAGVDAEKDLGFAGLHRLLRPFLDQRTRLPKPQRDALESAFGLQLDTPADRFLVGLACLTLLTNAATEESMIFVIDDAQWLDDESLGVLAFVGRRLSADRMGMLFGFRDGERSRDVLAGLQAVVIRGLPEGAALELLSTRVAVDVDTEVARRVVTATSGCPLALLELATELTEDQLVGGRTLSEPLPIGRRLEEHFLRQVRSLSQSTQLFLLVAATEASGDATLVRQASLDLGADGTGEDDAVARGLVVANGRIAFRHPLIQSAVYAGAPAELRRTVHNTLAARIDPESELDRRARHLAAAAHGPDEDVAQELEEAAHRAGRRGGFSAECWFLLQAAQLSPDSRLRATRLLRAATAALNAGLPQRAEALLDQARADLHDPLLRAEGLRLDGRIRVPLAQPPSAPALLLEAARAFAPLDRARARQCLLDALDAAVVSQHFTRGTSLAEVAHAALEMSPDGSTDPSLADLLLDGVATLFGSSYEAAVPLLRSAVEAIGRESITRDDIAAYFHVGLVVANELWDHEAFEAWSRRVERTARDQGALLALQVSLLALAKHETRAGNFAAAETHYDDAVEITRAMGGVGEFYELLKVDLHAWRGRDVDVVQAAAALSDGATAIGSAPPALIAQLALATLALGNGRYSDAVAAVRPLIVTNCPGYTCQALAIAVEAGVRADDREIADLAIAELRERARAAGTPWGLGLLARSLAMSSDTDDAELLYVEAIAYFERTPLATELAHTHLVYGEWLRRHDRRQDARTHLTIATESFSAMGASAFARRGQVELAATGEKVRKRSVETQNDLTPQEAQVARLAAAGLTNPEIAARLFLSANTVDYHLRKVFRKLGISSRRQLSAVEVQGRRSADENSTGPAAG